MHRETMEHQNPIQIGQVFHERQPPRRAWRVESKSGECYRLVCVNRPNIVRYPTADVLLDEYRYVRA